jgi:hypothetical protein
MVTLDQIKLLENKVAKAIDFISKVTEENSLLKGKLETYRKRVDELEGLVKRFKEDQGRIEEGILAALDRLNQFEDAIGKSLGTTVSPAPVKPAVCQPPVVETLAGNTATAEEPVPADSPDKQPVVPGMYLEEEEDLSDREFRESDEVITDDEAPEDKDTGELDIF